MKNISRVIFGVKFDEKDKSIESFKKLEFLKDSEIELVHISRMPDLITLSELNLPSFPDAEIKLVIEHAVLAKLKEISDEFVAAGFKGKITCRCLFSEKPYKKFCHFADEIKAELMVLIPEDKSVVFGSFIHHQFIYSKIPIFILRNLS